jgi:flagellar hook-basal body complex protein FliE
MSLNPVSAAGVPFLTPETATPKPDAAGGMFGTLMERFIGSANQTHEKMVAAVNDLAMGKTDNLHDVMLHAAQADLSFRLILEIRNRLTEAYQEVMKMQI